MKNTIIEELQRLEQKHEVTILYACESGSMGHRTDRDFLLSIRRGEFEYEDLLLQVEEKMLRIEELYRRSDLPEVPDQQKAEALLVQIRESFYKN